MTKRELVAALSGFGDDIEVVFQSEEDGGVIGVESLEPGVMIRHDFKDLGFPRLAGHQFFTPTEFKAVGLSGGTRVTVAVLS